MRTSSKELIEPLRRELNRSERVLYLVSDTARDISPSGQVLRA
jgi:hypothetical protein